MYFWAALNPERFYKFVRFLIELVAARCQKRVGQTGLFLYSLTKPNSFGLSEFLQGAKWQSSWKKIWPCLVEGGWLYTWLGLIIGNNEIHHKFVTTVCSLIVNFAWCQMISIVKHYLMNMFGTEFFLPYSNRVILHKWPQKPKMLVILNYYQNSFHFLWWHLKLSPKDFCQSTCTRGQKDIWKQFS